MSDWRFIIAAYAVTWIGILGYGVYLSRRLSRAAARLRAMDAGNASGKER